MEEIGFEDFLVVMSHFRPPSLHLSEEQRDSVRKEKLRCARLQNRAPEGHHLNSSVFVCLQFCSTCTTQTTTG